MANEVKLPRLGQGMESGTIVKWLKSEGDRVEKGEPLFEVDTDKATQEVEAESSGVLLRIAISAGDVPVGETIGVIGQEGEEVSIPASGPAVPPPGGAEAAGTNGAADPAPVPREAAPPEEARPATGGPDTVGGRAKASPLARRIARERGIDLGRLTGTGPDGRIVAEDVERAEAAEPVGTPSAAAQAFEPGEVESIPLTSIRKTIARRLTAAWQVPVFQLTVSADMTRANELVERSRELSSRSLTASSPTPSVRVTVTDLLVKIAARALIRHPEVNAQFTEEALLRFPSANVGIAVAAPQGLVVPVIRAVERLSLAEVAERRSEVVARARDAKLQPADLSDGTFTISNLGMFGVEQFIAVLNPPQAAILAVGATTDRPVAHEGQVVVRPMMTVTLTVDHRAVDGGPAADFLRTLKTFLEDPALAL